MATGDRRWPGGWRSSPAAGADSRRSAWHWSGRREGRGEETQPGGGCRGGRGAGATWPDRSAETARRGRLFRHAADRLGGERIVAVAWAVGTFGQPAWPRPRSGRRGAACTTGARRSSAKVLEVNLHGSVRLALAAMGVLRLAAYGQPDHHSRLHRQAARRRRALRYAASRGEAAALAGRWRRRAGAGCCTAVWGLGSARHLFAEPGQEGRDRSRRYCGAAEEQRRSCCAASTAWAGYTSLLRRNREAHGAFGGGGVRRLRSAHQRLHPLAACPVTRRGCGIPVRRSAASSRPAPGPARRPGR